MASARVQKSRGPEVFRAWDLTAQIPFVENDLRVLFSFLWLVVEGLR